MLQLKIFRCHDRSNRNNVNGNAVASHHIWFSLIPSDSDAQHTREQPRARILSSSPVHHRIRNNFLLKKICEKSGRANVVSHKTSTTCDRSKMKLVAYCRRLRRRRRLFVDDTRRIERKRGRETKMSFSSFCGCRNVNVKSWTRFSFHLKNEDVYSV